MSTEKHLLKIENDQIICTLAFVKSNWCLFISFENKVTKSTNFEKLINLQESEPEKNLMISQDLTLIKYYII